MNVTDALRTSEEVCNCTGCGRDFEGMVMWDGNRQVTRTNWCPPCLAHKTGEAKNDADAAAHKSREESWYRLCPMDYRNTDVSRVLAELLAQNRRIRRGGVPLSPQELISTVRQWNATEHGLGLVGATRGCKSRLMYLLLRRLHFRGHKCMAINGASFAAEFGASFEHGPGSAEKWIQPFIRVPILFWDDVDKLKLTEAMETAVYRVAEERRANGLKILFTSNSTPEKFAARMSDQRGGPLLTRLMDMSEVIYL